jgi:mono/diheme cytochrome c family protein
MALLFTATADAARADGKALFEANCAKCHGQTGLADTKTGKASKTPKMKGNADLQGDDVGEIVRGSVRDAEKKKHREVAKKVSDEDLAAIATYVKLLATTP